MASTADNASHVTGINAVSDVYVSDVYSWNTDLQTEIRNALDYAKDKNLKVVFQGGVQGEAWLTDGGTQQELEDLIHEARDYSAVCHRCGQRRSQR